VRLLVTGAFGTVGLVTLREAVARGHHVTALVRLSRRNKRIARRVQRQLGRSAETGSLKICWGDVRTHADVAAAVEDQDVVIHMAAMLPPRSELHPDVCEAVNVKGTKNLIEALDAAADGRQRADGQGTASAADGKCGPGLVYVSSVSVMGSTQLKDPPRTVDEPPRPSDAYSASKAAAEALVRDSRLPWAILRLSAVMPTKGAYRLSMARLMFDMSLAARCEILVDLDAAYALVQAAESLCDGGRIKGKTVFIAGGSDNGCQMDIAEMISHNLTPLGLKLPRPHLFRADVDSYYLDWYDTEEGQNILGYQRHGLKEWQRLSSRRFRSLRRVLWPVRGLAGLYLEWVGRRERRRVRRS